MNRLTRQISNPKKLLKINELLSSSKGEILLKNQEIAKKQSPDFFLYSSLIEKPLNLLFSIDQFFFEFSRKTYQQKKSNEFFQQLKERKKLSLFYGHLSHKEIMTLFFRIKKQKGFFSKNVFSQLEQRLDVVIYRCGIAQTIAEARQLIKHKKILVNHNIITIPSFPLNFGDWISVTPETHQKVSERLFKKVPNQLLSSQSFENFFSKLKKSIETTKGKKNLYNSEFHSKLFCEFFINLLCTRIKIKSFYSIKNQNTFLFKNTKKPFDFFNDFQNDTLILKTKHKNLIVLKWKSGFLNETKQFSLKKGGNFLPKLKNNKQDEFYVKKGFNLPVFWSFFYKNEQKSKFGTSYEMSLNNLDFIQFFGNHNEIEKKQSKLNSNKQLNFYRKSFLFFLKSLNKTGSFYHLVPHSLKKCILKQVSQKKSMRTNLTSQIIKPIHVEISYNLLAIIFLYSAQRLNFPFFLDLDLIVRSLR